METPGFGSAVHAEILGHGPNPTPHEQEIWFDKPAERWLEALPVGNGRIGGMVFGGVDTERIALSDVTMWSGRPSQNDVNPAARQHLDEIRQLLFAEKYAEGRALCEKYLLGRPASFGTNLPLPDVTIQLDRKDAVSYRRSLNLDEAVVRVAYRSGAHAYRREVFASNPDRVLVARIESDGPGDVNGRVSFGASKLPCTATTVGSDTLVLHGHAYEKVHSNGSDGVEFEARIRVRVEGGTLTAVEDAIVIKNARAVTLLIVTGTSYGAGQPQQFCESTLQRVATKPYADLRRAHILDHQSLFRRMDIGLGSTQAADQLPTDVRRKRVQDGENDPGLCALFFQYGRYLTIAGSRKDSPLPMALQGIWNDSLAAAMGWADDFHLDINTQQNYWPTEVCNLAECGEPVFHLTEGLRVSGRETATREYGAPGWVAHVVTNPWGYSAPGWGLGWGIFPTAGVWLAWQMWEHYLFTGDEEFLRKRAYPVLHDAAEFFLGYMVEHPRYKWLVTGPSTSPENSFRTADGVECSESMGPTCDRVLVHGLFDACIESARILGFDAEFGARLERAQEKLPPLRVGKHGQLQEWLEDFEEAQPNHRHTTHLISLYPESQITPEKTPELARAARVTIERRLNQPRWEDTEWTRANFIGFYARLHDGDAAYRHLAGLIGQDADNNLLTYSRGGIAGADRNIFAIDGNLGGAACMAEMLLQSHDGEIKLLPALPAAWPSGEVRGLCARGAIEVSLSWIGGKLQSATLRSHRGTRCAVRYGQRVLQVSLPRQQDVRLGLSAFEQSKA